MSVLHRDNEGRLWIRVHAHEQQLAAKDAEIEALKTEVERLKQELAQPWKHSEHWFNPETGQVECECCCSWALDCEKEHKELVALREQVSRLSARVGDEEWTLRSRVSGFLEEDFFLRVDLDEWIAARLEGK